MLLIGHRHVEIEGTVLGNSLGQCADFFEAVHAHPEEHAEVSIDRRGGLVVIVDTNTGVLHVVVYIDVVCIVVIEQFLPGIGQHCDCLIGQIGEIALKGFSLDREIVGRFTLGVIRPDIERVASDILAIDLAVHPQVVEINVDI